MYLDLVDLFSTPLKISYLLVLLPSIIAMVIAALSAKQLGGKLGDGLKMVAAGTIVFLIMYATLIIKEIMRFETMPPEQLRIFFFGSNLIGSIFLIMGFYKMYKISKKFKLF